MTKRAKPSPKNLSAQQVLSPEVLKRLNQTGPRKKVLHVFSGPKHAKRLHPRFLSETEWDEIRLDPFERNEPDIVGSFPEFALLPDGAFDAIWIAHGIQRLSAREIPAFFAQAYRVLAWRGVLICTTPDLQTIAKLLWEGATPEETIFKTPQESVTALDLLYGSHSADGIIPAPLQHKTAFYCTTLGRRFKESGFFNIEIKRDNLVLWGIGHKLPKDTPNLNDKIIVIDQHAPPMPKGNPKQPDELDMPPAIWKALGLKKPT